MITLRRTVPLNLIHLGIAYDLKTAPHTFDASSAVTCSVLLVLEEKKHIVFKVVMHMVSKMIV